MASHIKTDKISTQAGKVFNIPAAGGTSGQFLKTDGAAGDQTLSFDSIPAGVSLTGSTNTWIPTITGSNALTGTANFTYDGNILDVKNSGTASSIKLYCESSNAHYQEIKAAPHSGSSNWTLTLPPTVPTANGQVLSATTGGVSSWVASGIGADSCRLSKSATQTMTNNTNMTITWDVEDFDTSAAGNMANLANNRIDIQTAGKYLIGAWIQWTSASASESRTMWLYYYDLSTTTDTVAFRKQISQTSSSGGADTMCGGLIDLAAGDWGHLKGFQNGQSANAQGGANKTQMWVTRIE